MKATLKSLSAILMILTLALPAQAASLGASGAQGKVITSNETALTSRVVNVQSYSQSGSGQLIPPSVALRNALRYAGGKGLGIKLRRGARPVYVVKIRKGGQVRRVRVDARNGNVLGR